MTGLNISAYRICAYDLLLMRPVKPASMSELVSSKNLSCGDRFRFLSSLLISILVRVLNFKTDKLSVNRHNHKQTRRQCASEEGCSRVVGVLTDSQLPQAALKLRFLLQDPQQVRGLHVLQLHLPVDVDFVTEAHVNQTGAVLTLLTCVLTCEHTSTTSAYITGSFYSSCCGSVCHVNTDEHNSSPLLPGS